MGAFLHEREIITSRLHPIAAIPTTRIVWRFFRTECTSTWSTHSNSICCGHEKREERMQLAVSQARIRLNSKLWSARETRCAVGRCDARQLLDFISAVKVSFYAFPYINDVCTCRTLRGRSVFAHALTGCKTSRTSGLLIDDRQNRLSDYYSLREQFVDSAQAARHRVASFRSSLAKRILRNLMTNTVFLRTFWHCHFISVVDVDSGKRTLFLCKYVFLRIIFCFLFFFICFFLLFAFSAGIVMLVGSLREQLFTHQAFWPVPSWKFRYKYSICIIRFARFANNRFAQLEQCTSNSNRSSERMRKSIRGRSVGFSVRRCRRAFGKIQ